MAYYEKWIVALAQCMVQRGVVTSEELARKMEDVMFMRQHHDMGGRPAGKVEPTEHDYAEWERRVDALAVLLGSKKILTVDERRRAIESLPPQAQAMVRQASEQIAAETDAAKLRERLDEMRQMAAQVPAEMKPAFDLILKRAEERLQALSAEKK